MITTSSLISSSRLDGTKVYNPSGEKLGSIESLLIDKISGQVRYAVMEFGGFLGVGADRHPLPWSTLKYDTNQEGYVVSLTKDQLRQGPKYPADSVPEYTDEYGRRVHDYYGVPWV